MPASGCADWEICPAHLIVRGYVGYVMVERYVEDQFHLLIKCHKLNPFGQKLTTNTNNNVSYKYGRAAQLTPAGLSHFFIGAAWLG